MLTIHSGARVLFDGDSVTDCGRDRQDRHSLSGYNDKIARNAHAGVEFFNRGISGDRSKDLLARIESDLRDTKPDVVSILIGINDTWAPIRRKRSHDGACLRAKYARNFENGARVRR